MTSSVDFALVIIVAIISLNSVNCAIKSEPSIEVPVKNVNNFVFPSEINAIVGEDIYFKVTKPVADQTDCLYRQKGGKDVSTRTPDKPNYQQWQSETCGLIIKNIALSDQGLWRLTSTHQNKVFARGTVMIRVREKMEIPKEMEVNTNDPIKLAETPSYCYVERPDDSNIMFPNYEQCDFPKYQNELEAAGKWNVLVGLKGKTREVSFDVNFKPLVEEIQTFTETDAKTGSLKMKCKLINTQKMMKFCRFLRLSDNFGYNLEDGFGDEKYRYMGQGLENNECGISIQNPDANDKSIWKCFMGVEENESAKPGAIEKLNEKTIRTVGAIVRGVESHKGEGEIEAESVFGLNDMSVNLLCRSKSPTDYCWFRDPTGNKISVSDRKPIHKDDVFRYYGTGIELGDCGLTIMKATYNDSGLWSCHMGSAHVTVIDRVKEINVRIAETSLVSTSVSRDGQVGSSLIIDCKSIPSHVPLDYCRFVLPDGTGFSLDEKTTIHNPFLNNYYFNPNRQMKSGFCSVVVKSVDRSHLGKWTCAARLMGRDAESHDEFHVNVVDADGVSVAAISGIAIGITFGVGIIAVVLFIVYRRYPIKRLRRRTEVTAVSYISSPDRVSIGSSNSNGSNNDQIELAEVHPRQSERL